MGAVAPEERKNVGIAFNTSRKAIEEMLQDAKAKLEEEKEVKGE